MGPLGPAKNAVEHRPTSTKALGIGMHLQSEHGHMVQQRRRQPGSGGFGNDPAFENAHKADAVDARRGDGFIDAWHHPSGILGKLVRAFHDPATVGDHGAFQLEQRLRITAANPAQPQQPTVLKRPRPRFELCEALHQGSIRPPDIQYTRRMRRFFLLATLALACSSTPQNAPDATAMDASAHDAATPDATTADASFSDASPDDAGRSDASVREDASTPFLPIPLSQAITEVQPMTGIVLWEESWNDDAVKDAIRLEYAYIEPSSIVAGADSYDWAAFEAFLDRIAGRQHQALVRFYYTYPGRQTAVPDYIKALPDYEETTGQVEGNRTHFPDWRNAELRRAHLAFFEAFAERYDADPRIAFLQVGFGLWGEYHIYEGPRRLGREFPSKAFQQTFFETLSDAFEQLHWSISIDAGDGTYSPMPDSAALRGLAFGNFDDSFMHADHGGYNESMWNVFEHSTRYLRSPHGGELSYYTDFDQRHVLDPAGIHGRSFETLAQRFHISYMIGNDQPSYQGVARIREASLATGYRFAITRFEANETQSRVRIENRGIAPLYYDAFVAIDGVRSSESLKGLAPGEGLDLLIEAGGAAPTLSIECDRLVSGQRIGFEAEL